MKGFIDLTTLSGSSCCIKMTQIVGILSVPSHKEWGQEYIQKGYTEVQVGNITYKVTESSDHIKSVMKEEM